jgi:hypothetical protein
LERQKNTQYEMSQSTSHSTTSTVPLRAPLNAPKDFQSNPQSQSTYGLSGITPSPVEKVTTTVPTPTTAPPQATNKNSQSACADLQPTSGGEAEEEPFPFSAFKADLLIDTADDASVFHSERHPEGENENENQGPHCAAAHAAYGRIIGDRGLVAPDRSADVYDVAECMHPVLTRRVIGFFTSSSQLIFLFDF